MNLLNTKVLKENLFGILVSADCNTGNLIMSIFSHDFLIKNSLQSGTIPYFFAGEQISPFLFVTARAIFWTYSFSSQVAA